MPTLIRGIFGGGGGKIKDATALPEDVRKGKVFYNNEGRQEGTNDIPNVKTLKVMKRGVSSGGMGSFTRVHFQYYPGVLNPPSMAPNNSLTNYGYQQIIYKAIIGLTINGAFYPCAHQHSEWLGFELFNETKGFIFVIQCYNDGTARIFPQEEADKFDIIIHYI